MSSPCMPSIPSSMRAGVLASSEGARLHGPDIEAWRKWGPYLSERQWGTVREDYSACGDAWSYLPHDHARSRAYRWGEDGIAGFGSSGLEWCLGLALWNGHDPILKERLFGLANGEGNHGEDVKELYWYHDALPSHAYQRMTYRYPQAAYPYQGLLDENARRGREQGEYELVDTGVLEGSRYFDITTEYAKGSPDDILMRVRVHNCADVAASIHVLPQMWARNTWSWEPEALPGMGSLGARPLLRLAGPGHVLALHPCMPDMELWVEGANELLFCDNETNTARLYGAPPHGYPKDCVDTRVVHGILDAVNPAMQGSKCAAWHRLEVGAGQTLTLRMRLRASRPDTHAVPPFQEFDALVDARLGESDEFYAAVGGHVENESARAVQRAALGGMLWSKQYYGFDVTRWLDGDSQAAPPPEQRGLGRNSEWRHLCNSDIISMPDKWEYPWYASWDLDFHCLTLALVDPDFAKQQVLLLTGARYMHPDGRLPAYEWEFGDANPPIHAWAALRVYRMDAELTGRQDRAFLIRVFTKLSLNFAWWVNRRDAAGRNIFQGGFLGLDNIGIFDRSKPLPTGGMLSQSDGTAWMASYALNLMRIAIELALHESAYEDAAIKFFQHFLLIAEAAAVSGGLWDEQDGFFYDVLELPDGQVMPLRARSLVGLMPLYAVEVLDQEVLTRLPNFAGELEWFLDKRPDLARLVSHWDEPGQGRTMLLSLLRGHRTKQLLLRMLDPKEFLSPHGIRGVSKHHQEHPFVLDIAGQRYDLHYEPAESRSGLFGGNSNWRGPVWMPVNYLFVESLRQFQAYYGDDFQVEYPTGSGHMASLRTIADDLSRRLISLFVPDEAGVRPCLGRQGHGAGEQVLFHEYFDGDTGRGLGASHQTGWTGLVALLIHQMGSR